MIARNILAIAPEATIWDAPLLPLEDEQDAPPNPSTASQLFQLIKWAFEERGDTVLVRRTQRATGNHASS